MADWVALAGIASTAVVAVTAQVGNSLTKRGDRKHASQLNFNERVWESKSAALVSVITQCQRLKDAADVDSSDGAARFDPSRRRGSVLLALGELGAFYDDINADLLAYADKSVTAPFTELSKLVNRERLEHRTVIARIQQTNATAAQEVDEEDPNAFFLFRKRMEGRESILGRMSTLDVDAVVKLCDQIIEAARKDLRGK